MSYYTERGWKQIIILKLVHCIMLVLSSVNALLLLQQVKQLSALGVTVVVTGGKVGEMSLHFLNKFKIMAVR